MIAARMPNEIAVPATRILKRSRSLRGGSVIAANLAGPPKLVTSPSLLQQRKRRVLSDAPCRSIMCRETYGTVLVAGSLQGPVWLLAPIARTRSHCLVPLVKLFTIALVLPAVIF